MIVDLKDLQQIAQQAHHPGVAWRGADGVDDATFMFTFSPAVALALIDLIREYGQGIWSMLRELGFDPDGDDTPAALVAGMGHEGFIAMAVREAADFRAERDEE